MAGTFTRTASGHNSYNISDGEQNDIYKIADILEREFGFKMAAVPVAGLDGIYWETQKDEIELIAGWDIWSGLFVMSQCFAGDEAVAQIGSFIDNMEK